MKLIDTIKSNVIFADSKKDYVFDMHIAQKHNAKKLENTFSEITNYIKQTQRNEFEVTPIQSDGTWTTDSGLISVTKSGLVWSVTTSYDKVFSGALVYDADGRLVTTGWKLIFGDLINNTTARTTINIEFDVALAQTYRIVLL